MKPVGLNTLTVLQNAPQNGIKKRDFVYFTAKNRDDGSKEHLGLWNGTVPVDFQVIDPTNGNTVTRTYQPWPALKVPAIPAKAELEVRTMRMSFANIDPVLLSAVRQYDLKMGDVEIHRGVWDPISNVLTDPASCRFRGFVNKAPITQGASNEPGGIELELVSIARFLTVTSGDLYSDAVFQAQRNDRMLRYIDEAPAWRIWWGQEVTVIHPHDPKKVRYF